ncbi:MAG: serine/threonine-protein kinase, partial [Polyangiaceae bacterium]
DRMSDGRLTTADVNVLDFRELARGTRLLDRYAIIDRVGEGGMSTIYRAHDERLDRVVCVKLLRTLLEGSGSSSAGGSVYQATYSHFLQEALALSRLQHPNTLRIYDFGYLGDTDTSRPFQISEFLDAGNLEMHVKQRGGLSPEETSAILERITGAVDEAHEHNIIHRDIKPPNILFTRIGEFLMPKLADFGIAHSDIKKRPGADAAHSAGETTMSVVALFSPRWAAPEQLAGVTEGPYTDVYALALCTAYMLAGRPLFEGSDVRGTFGDRMRGDELVTRTLHAMGITSPALEVLLRALTADARKRTPTPAAFFEEIRGALGGVRRSALPPNTVPARRPAPPVTLSIEPVGGSQTGQAQPIAPPERAMPFAQQGRRAARVVDVHERLDVSLVGDSGAEIRLRISMLPSRDFSFRINIKGLNCFISKGGRPTPAITADADGATEFLDTAWVRLGKIGWSFGVMKPGGRVFRMDDGEMMIPSSHASHAVALYLGADVLIMCRHV